MLNGLTLINGISIRVPKPMNSSSILHIWTYTKQHYASYESKSGHSDLRKRGVENFMRDCSMNLLDGNLPYITPKREKKHRSPTDRYSYFYGIHWWCSVLQVFLSIEMVTWCFQPLCWSYSAVLQKTRHKKWTQEQRRASKLVHYRSTLTLPSHSVPHANCYMLALEEPEGKPG